jgi:hypothetical protein
METYNWNKAASHSEVGGNNLSFSLKPCMSSQKSAFSMHPDQEFYRFAAGFQQPKQQERAGQTPPQASCPLRSHIREHNQPIHRNCTVSQR